MDKKWVLKPAVSPEWRDRFPQIDEVVLQLLLDRGLNTQELIDEFLNPDYLADIHDPFLFSNMVKAVERINQAIDHNELITIYGDYDADGVSGSVILANVLEALGAKSDVYLPYRDKEGYGLNSGAIEYLAKQGTKLIITVDCGISNLNEIDQANALGIEVIVTDHHQQQTSLPKAINIHPKIEGETYPFKGLAGGGVAFKLAQGLIKNKLKKDPNADAKYWEGFEKWSLDMVSISTVADLMPLLGENRTLVKYGLIVLNKGRRIGLRYLIKVAGLWPEADAGLAGRTEAKLDTDNIAFQIAPRINAAGRMNHANVALKLLTAKTDSEALALAQELNKNNQDRQALTEIVMKEALDQIGTVAGEDIKVVSAFKKDWTLAVAGIVASKLVEVYHRPAMVMGMRDDKVVGSVRSLPSFNFVDAFIEVKDLFSKFGGHPMAAGFTLARAEDREILTGRLDQIIKRQLAGKDLTPELIIDKELFLDQVSWELADKLWQFEPYGKENPVPKFLTRTLKILGIGAVGNGGKHLRLVVGDDSGNFKKAIGFGFGRLMSKLKLGDRIDVVYELEINEWNGNRELQLKLVDIKLCQ